MSSRFLVASSTLALLPLAVTAQTVRLNSPFDLQSTVGSVLDAQVHPNAGQILFRATARLPEVAELFHVPAEGDAHPGPVAMLAPGRSVEKQVLSSDGRWVVYRADREEDERLELYAHRVGTLGWKRLSGPLVTGGDVKSFKLAPGNARVIYVADAFVNGVDVLFSVPIDGSGPAVPLFDAPTFGFEISPNGTRLAFLTGTPGSQELRTLALDGTGSSVTLDTGTLDSFAWAPNGAQLVYRKTLPGTFRLRRAPADGSGPAVDVSTHTGQVRSFLVSPNSARIVYEADRELAGVLAVYSTPFAGGATVRLSAPPAGGAVTGLDSISPDSSRVVYLQDGILSAPIDGSSPAVLLDVPPASASVVRDLRHAGSRVFYQVGKIESAHGLGFFDPHELRSVPVDGSEPAVRLDEESRATEYSVAADGGHVLYRSTAEFFFGSQSYVGSLHSVPSDGSESATMLLADGVASLGLVTGPATPAGFALSGKAAFIATVAGQPGLYTCDSFTGAGLVRLSAELATGTSSDVGRPSDFSSPSVVDVHAKAFDLDPSGARVLFTADANTDQVFELHLASTTTGAPLLLDAGHNVRDFLITGDGQFGVYRVDPPFQTRAELRTVALDPPGTPSVITTLAGEYVVTPDGTRVVFAPTTGLSIVPLTGGAPLALDTSGGLCTQLRVSSALEVCVYIRSSTLYSVPLDGSAAPLALLPAGETTSAIVLTPDQSEVISLSSPSAGVFFVRRQPVDGSGPAVDLYGTAASGPLVPSPDGTRVVFQSFDTSTSSMRLISARLSGSPDPVTINVPLFGGGDVVRNYVFTPDSQGVLYVADQNANDVYELFRAPADGSSTPVRLSGTLVPGGDVQFSSLSAPTAMRVSPDGSRVLYVADQNTDGLNELYSAPTNGSAAAVKVSGPMALGGGLVRPDALRISPDSTRVVYAAYQNSSILPEAFAVAIDGSSPAVRVSLPLDSPGCTGAFEITSSGTLVYQASQRLAVTELFARPLPTLPTPLFDHDRH